MPTPMCSVTSVGQIDWMATLVIAPPPPDSEEEAAGPKLGTTTSSVSV
jgi:hypothetical protein